MSIGPGVGGNVGGSQQPLQREVEASAWTEVNKAFVAIVKDTLVMPFTKFGGNLWKYDSSANRPLLAPLGMLRMNTEPKSSGDDSWRTYFDDLIQKLPEDVANALQEDSKQPFNERNPVFVTVNALLMYAAKASAWTEAFNHQVEPDSPFIQPGSPLEARINLSQKMGENGVQGAIADGATIYASVSNYLTQKGPNGPNFDTQISFFRQMGDAFTALTTLSHELEHPESLEDIQKRQEHLTNALNTLNNAYSRSYSGEDLQVFGSTFYALGVLSGALGVGSPSLYIGLELALDSSSQNKLIGNTLQTTINFFVNGLTSLFPTHNAGKERYFELLTTFTALASLGFGHLVSEHGITFLPNPHADLTTEKEHRLFAFETISALLASSNVLKNTFTEAAAASGADEKIQTVVANVLCIASLLLGINGAAHGSDRDFDKLVLDLKDILHSYLAPTNAFLKESIVNESLNGEMMTPLSVALQQAEIALHEEDIDSFKHAFSSLLSLAGTPPEALQKDIKQAEEFADRAMNAWLIGPEDQTNTMTGITHTAA